jgi:peptidoglycan LD-endopeptidase LytH
MDRQASRRPGRPAGRVAAVTGFVCVALLLAGAVSAQAAAARATALRLTATPTELVQGDASVLRIRLLRDDSGTGVADARVRLQSREVGTSTWSLVDSVRTDGSGAARLRVVPQRHTDYRAVFSGTARWAPSRSRVRTVRVGPQVTAETSASTIWLGRAVRITGRASPTRAGQQVRLQRRGAAGWTVVEAQRFTAAGRYEFRVKPASAGDLRYRVVAPADDTHDRGVSRTLRVRVRGYAFPVRPAGVASYPRDHHDYPATDIFAPCGTTVVAARAGRVREVSETDLWDPDVNAGPTRGGLSVTVVGTDGVRYYGSHLATIAPGIAPGVKVATGQVLGTVGRTGSARPTPCHLHFGISPPCGEGDWAVRRGVVWPWPYLDAWSARTDRSPAREVTAWAAANGKRCPAG